MSAIAPPPVGTEALGLTTSRSDRDVALAGLVTRHDRSATRDRTHVSRMAWLGSLVGLVAFGAVSAAAALYSLGALSAWRVAKAPPSKERALALWGTQLALGIITARIVAKNR